MKIDIVNAFNSKYIGSKNKDNTSNLVYQAFSYNEHPFLFLEDFAKIIESNPDFVLEPFSLDGIEFTNRYKLNQIIESSQILELFDAYKEAKKLQDEFKLNLNAYHKGERDTSPFFEETPLYQKIDKIFEGKDSLDKLVSKIKHRLLWQHINNPFISDTFSLPLKFFSLDSILRIAKKTGDTDCGKGPYFFDEFEIKEIETKMPDFKKTLFTVNTVELIYLRNKEGTRHDDFSELFYSLNR